MLYSHRIPLLQSTFLKVIFLIHMKAFWYSELFRQITTLPNDAIYCMYTILFTADDKIRNAPLSNSHKKKSFLFRGSLILLYTHSYGNMHELMLK